MIVFKKNLNHHMNNGKKDVFANDLLIQIYYIFNATIVKIGYITKLVAVDLKRIKYLIKILICVKNVKN